MKETSLGRPAGSRVGPAEKRAAANSALALTGRHG
jgi:hypothetical protein